MVGEAFGTYLILERGNDELVFIDKHAAHERLLYERLKAQGSGGEAQALLEPVAVTLDKEEYTQLLAHGRSSPPPGSRSTTLGRAPCWCVPSPCCWTGRTPPGR